MAILKEDGNSVFWKKVQGEKEVKDGGKMLNIGKETDYKAWKEKF